jgi:hypothetical protein
VGCKKEDGPVGPSGILSFDLTTGKSWTYRWTFTTSDSSGTIINRSVDTIIVRIVSTNDSLGSYKGLTRFELQSIIHPEKISKVWYKSVGDSLAEIAYFIQTNSLGFPKSRIQNTRTALQQPSLTSLFPKTIRELMKSKGIQDTAFLRQEIRIVYRFPLSIGKTWTSFKYPFLQTREVIGSEILDRAGNKYQCAKIQTRLPEFGPNIEWFDYVAKEGLIERQVKHDSLAITTADSPEIKGYGHANELLELIQ